MQAALALPILVVPAKAGAVDTGEVGITVLHYKERGLMKVTEPVLWGRAQFMQVWEVQASAAVDVVTGASPQLVTNASGRPVQSITAASVTDRRKLADVKVTRRLGEISLAVSGSFSREEDYESKAFGLEARLDFNQRNTTLALAYGQASDRIESSDDITLDQPRDTREYLLGVTAGGLADRRGAEHAHRDARQEAGPTIRTAHVHVFSHRLADSRARTAGPASATRSHGFTLPTPTFPRPAPRSRPTTASIARLGHTGAHIEVAWQQALGERWALRGVALPHAKGRGFLLAHRAAAAAGGLSSDQRLAASAACRLRCARS